MTDFAKRFSRLRRLSPSPDAPDAAAVPPAPARPEASVAPAAAEPPQATALPPETAPRPAIAPPLAVPPRDVRPRRALSPPRLSRAEAAFRTKLKRAAAGPGWALDASRRLRLSAPPAPGSPDLGSAGLGSAPLDGVVRRIEGSAGGGRFILDAPASALTAAAAAELDGLDPFALSDPDGRAQALEAAFADAFDVFETALGVEIAVERVWSDRDAAPARAERTVSLAVEIRGGPSDVRADLAVSADLAELLLARAPTPRARRGAELARQTPIRAALRYGGVDVRLADVRRLEPGDALAIDAPFAAEATTLVLAERLAAPVVAGPRGARLTRAPAPARAAGAWEVLTMDARDADQPDGPPLDAYEETSDAVAAPVSGGRPALDDLPVRVVVEAARAEMTVAELAALDVGSVVDLAAAPDLKVTLYANGRRFARGSLFDLDGRLGVEIDALLGEP